MCELNEEQIDNLSPLVKEVIKDIDAYIMEDPSLDCLDEVNGDFDERKLEPIVHHIGDQLSAY